jgi:hypothetical protein
MKYKILNDPAPSYIFYVISSANPSMSTKEQYERTCVDIIQRIKEYNEAIL